MTARYVLAAAAVLILLGAALVALLGGRSGLAQPSPSPSISPGPTATATGGPTATAAASQAPTPRPSPSPAAGFGTISGEVSYPAGSRPELEVYAIDARDPSRWFSVTTPEYVGQGVGGTGSPSPDPGKRYSIQVPPGTYHVVAYIKDSPRNSQPGLYSQYVLCGLRASCSDHTLIEVRVVAGETRTEIDPADWYYQPGQATYPPRPTPR